MGDIKRKRKLYTSPRQRFDSVRIKEENGIVSKYGLKNKREIWKANSIADKFRQRAKKLISASDEDKDVFIKKLNKLGIPVENISDILGLDEKDILNRRLQTIIFKKKFANTPKQARQLIVHKYVLINGVSVNVPSYWVSPEIEAQISIKEKKEKPSTSIEETEEDHKKKEEENEEGKE